MPVLLPFVLSGKGVEVSVISSSTKALAPGSHYNFVFSVYNSDSTDVVLFTRLGLPAGWTDLTQDPGFHLKSGAREIKILSVYIPSQTRPGNYWVTYSLLTDNDLETGRVSLPVSVSSVKKLSVDRLDAPPFVLAGNPVDAAFIIKNEGNDVEKILLTPDNCKVEGENHISLSPGEVRIVHVFADTDLKQGKMSSLFLKLTASIPVATDSLVEASSYTRVDVFPVEVAQDDAFKRFPVMISAGYLVRQRDDNYYSGFQGEVFGKGFIDEKQKKQLEFLAIGPNRFDLSVLGRHDQYYLTYKTPGFFVHIGDKTFSSTLLTENARYGRGAEIQYSNKKIELGGFWQMPRFFSDIKKEYSAWGRYNINDKTGLRVGYFGKSAESGGTANLYTISGWARPFARSLVEAEFSRGVFNGKDGNGMLLKGEAERDKFNLSFLFMTTGKNYPGYYSNTTQATANLNYLVTKKLTINMNYRQDALNPKLDTLYGAAPFTNSYRGGIYWRYSNKGTFSLFAGNMERQDRLPSSLFHYSEDYLRGAIYQQTGNFNITIEGELANNNNFNTGNRGRSWLASADIGYAFSQGHAGIFAGYSNTLRYGATREQQLIYGGDFSFRLKDCTELNLNFQNSYSVEEYYRDRSLLRATLRQKIGRHQYLDLACNYALPQKQVDKKDFSVAVKFTVELNIPVKRIAEYGELVGAVADAGSGHVEGIRLFCGGHTAITGKNGEFKFRNLLPGKYYLLVDQTSLEMNAIPDIRQPMEVVIAPGKNYYSFGLTRAAVISGHVLLRGDETPGVSVSSNPGQVIVELTREGEETRRELVPLGDYFVFDNLRPGPWRVSVLKNGLGDAYRIETGMFDVQPIPGEKINLEIVVSKKAKKIKFMQEEIEVSFNINPEQ